MAEIRLRGGEICFVDDDDLAAVSRFDWRAAYNNRRGFRTLSNVFYTPNRLERVYLHRFLLNPPDHLEVDHRDRNPLNNRRENLRLATHAENCRNRSLPRTNKLGVKGVHRDKSCTRPRYIAQIKIDGKQFKLGRFDTVEEAAAAYAAAAPLIHGEFACPAG